VYRDENKILPSAATNYLAHHHLRLAKKFTDERRKWNASQSSERPLAVGKLNIVFGFFQPMGPPGVLASGRFVRALYTLIVILPMFLIMFWCIKWLLLLLIVFFSFCVRSDLLTGVVQIVISTYPKLHYIIYIFFTHSSNSVPQIYVNGEPCTADFIIINCNRYYITTMYLSRYYIWKLFNNSVQGIRCCRFNWL